MSKRFTFGSLFSGIGGIDLGLERAGMRCEWQVEKDEFCQKVLQKHWPNVTRHGDIRGLDTSTLAPVDLIAGGFPCQPHSVAGQRKASKDERDLWGEFARIIRELRPRWVLCENVVGLLSSENGRFYSGVLRDLAQAGYDAQWFVLSAAQFGAPQLRERVFIVAHSTRSGQQERADTTGISEKSSASGPVENTIYARQPYTRYVSPLEVPQWQEPGWQPYPSGIRRSGKSDVGYTDRSGWQEQHATTVSSEQGLNPWCTSAPGIEREPQPGICGDTTRLPAWLDRYCWPAGPGQLQHEWEPPRVVTDHVPDRAKRLKALGNAVVPQVAEYIGRMIMESEYAEYAERLGKADQK